MPLLLATLIAALAFSAVAALPLLIWKQWKTAAWGIGGVTLLAWYAITDNGLSACVERWQQSLALLLFAMFAAAAVTANITGTPTGEEDFYLNEIKRLNAKPLVLVGALTVTFIVACIVTMPRAT